MSKKIEKETNKYVISWLFPIVMVLAALFFYQRLPEQIPTHFSFSGGADRYGSKMTIFLLPLISILLILFKNAMPHIDPRHTNYRKFRPQYEWMFVPVQLLFLVLEIYTIAYGLGRTWNINTAMLLLIGCLFTITGNLLPKLKQTYFVGIRTPWTLNSEEVWFKTHRFSGKIWVVGGILMILLCFVPSNWLPYTLIPLILLLCLIPMVYSYMIYQKLPKEESR